MAVQIKTTADGSAIVAQLRAALDASRLAGERLRTFHGMPVQPFAFFPGGNGLLAGADAGSFPLGGVLVLGSNWGHVNHFVDSDGQLLSTDERNGPTWRPLLKSLAKAGIEPHDCFFSNVWPVLHTAGTGSNTDTPIKIWLADDELTRECLRLLAETLRLMRPIMIVALGKGPAAFLARRWPQQLGAWSGYSIRSMDECAFAEVEIAADVCAVCCAITHPSNAAPNALRRAVPYTGMGGEVLLLRHAHERALALQAARHGDLS